MANREWGDYVLLGACVMAWVSVIYLMGGLQS